MITIGVDFSKRTSSYCVLNEKGQRIKRCKLENKPELMAGFFASLPQGEARQLAMEATRNWGLYHDAIIGFVDHFYLGHPKKMKAITHSETKNDQNDAETIAKLTQSSYLPKAHVSSLDTRQLRSLLRFRHFIMNERRAIRNQVQTLIDRNLWPSERPASFKNPFCQRGLLWLTALALPCRERFILNQCMATYHELTRKIKELEAFVEQQALDLPGLTYLRTIPGFKRSKVNAYVLLVEIDTIHRFRKAKGLAHYAGLIPREYSSGELHRTGRLIKSANMHLRTALLESSLGAILSDRGLKAYYQQVKARSGAGSAIVATARKLCYAIYHVLKEQRPYYPEMTPPVAASGPLSASTA